MIYIIFIVFALISYAVQQVLRSKFRNYSKMPLPYNMTGREVAEKMLRECGVYDVTVKSVEGELTDHYNPLTKTVNLSSAVYSSNSIAAAAVAAHECGHAVQHAVKYPFLQLRSSLVPIISFASQWVQWVLLAGILLLQTFPQLMLIGIILFAMTTLFSFITLPVEINAICNVDTYPKAKDALTWAAYTYVVAALSSLATLVYYILIFSSRRD